MSAHDKLARAGIVPTIDAERAYRLGFDDGREFEGDMNDKLLREQDKANDRIAWLERLLTEIGLLASRRSR